MKRVEKRNGRWVYTLIPLMILVVGLFDWVSLTRALPSTNPIIYVDASATGAKDGTSWENAYTDLQDALTTAISGTQIWVAEGIYKPTDVITDRTASFHLVDGVALYGGFPTGGSSFEERDWDTYQTILSGDIDNNDLAVPANDASQIIGNNSLHVILGGDERFHNFLLDGFVISGGQANGAIYQDVRGGGIYHLYGDFTLLNSKIKGNIGGGVFCPDAKFVLTNVIFQGNYADGGGSGMMCYPGGQQILTNVLFKNNTTTGDGGAIFLESSSITLINVSFDGNHANGNGGGIAGENINIDLQGVIFRNNSASGNGGSIFIPSNGSRNIQMMNVTFYGNSADVGTGAGVDVGAIVYCYRVSNMTLTDVTFNGNSTLDLYIHGDTHRSQAKLTNVMFNSNSMGGGIETKQIDTILANVDFVNNFGAGMVNKDSNLLLNNVTFRANKGGGMHNTDSDVSLNNVVFSQNSIFHGYGAGIHHENGTLTVSNSILWHNFSHDVSADNRQIYTSDSSQILIENTLVENSGGSGLDWDTSLGVDGGGNIDANPRFVRDPNPGPDALWGTADDDPGDLRLQTTSPAIDAGDNNALPPDTLDLDGDGNTAEPMPFDADGNPRLVDIITTPDTGIGSAPIVDMGAYEAQLFLQLAQSVSPLWAGLGEEVTYHLSIHNAGPETATGVTITEVMPISVTITDIASSLPLTTSHSTATDYVWQLPDLPIGTTGHITITGVVSTALNGGETLWSTATITANEPEPNLNDNLATTPLYITEIIYVDVQATGNNDGSSWQHAYNSLQPALTRAYRGAKIWVAEGVYKPTYDPTDRTATFQLVDGAELYGGFPAGGSTFAQRHPQAYPTILSGDIDNNDLLIPATHAHHIVGNNSYHVVTSQGASERTLLDGFTISGGHANGAGHANGGGVYNGEESHPRLQTLLIIGNQATNGAGFYNSNSHPTLVDVTFMGNEAVSAGGGFYNDSSLVTLTNLTFQGNTASNGGGFYNGYSSGVFNNAVFVGNAAQANGGGLYNDGGSPILNNTTFAGNEADAFGGGVYNASNSIPEINNSLFWGNRSGSSSLAQQQIANINATPTLHYALIQGAFASGLWDQTLGLDGGGNVDADPAFVRSPDAGTDGSWGTADDDYGNLHLQAQSAAIDAGSNLAVPPDTADLDQDHETSEPLPYDRDGRSRFTDVTTTPDTGLGETPLVDIGAYEAQLHLRAQVLFPDGTPVPEAILFHLPVDLTQGALPLGGHQEPLRTNAQGLLHVPGAFHVGDGLMAAWPVTTTADYDVYHTSAAPIQSGLDWHRVADTALTQTLTISSGNPLLLFHLDISLEWDASDDAAYLARLGEDVAQTAVHLFDLTNGQATLGRVRLFHNRENWAESDVLIYARNDLRPSANIGGIATESITETLAGSGFPTPTEIRHAYGPGWVRMPANWNRYGQPNGSIQGDWARAFAHELSHYLLYLPDNYLGVSGDYIIGTECAGSVMTDAYDADDSEMLTRDQWLGECLDTIAQYTTGRTDWETIRHFYPMLRDDRLLDGPYSLPLAVTQLEIVPPTNGRSTLTNPYFYLRDESGQSLSIPSHIGRAYILQTDDQIIPIGSPVGDDLLAQGVATGDTICVFSDRIGQRRIGCLEEVADNRSHNLTLTPVADWWQPQLTVQVVTTRTFVLTVTQPITDGQLWVQFYGHAITDSHPIPLTALSTEQHTTTLTFDQPVFGAFAHVWWSENPLQYQEIVELFINGGWGPDCWSWGFGTNTESWQTPVTSPDGQIRIYDLENILRGGQNYALQTLPIPPNLPIWFTPVGQAYRLQSTQEVSSTRNLHDLSPI